MVANNPEFTIDCLDKYVYLEALDVHPRCVESQEGFEDLFIRRLPLETQQNLSFFFPGGEAKRDDDGLVRRGGPQHAGDAKFFLHVRPWVERDRQLDQLLMRKRGIIPTFDQWWSDFMDWYQVSLSLCDRFYELVKEFAGCIDTNSPGYNLVEQLCDPTARLKHVLRYLYYDPQQVGVELADLHRDFSLLTIDAYTTGRGLCLSPNSKGIMTEDDLIEEKPGHVVAFAGRKIVDVTQGKLNGICHGVISTEFKPRGAMVFFAHGPGPMGPSCPD